MRGRQSPRQLIDAPLLTEQEIAELLAVPRTKAVAARRAPRVGRPGERVSSRHGSGTDFAEPRAYQAGDDPRRLDWRATARSGTPLVRTYHAEFSQPLCLVIDRRAAMRFGTRVRLKVTQAVRVALRLAGREIRTGGELAAVLLDAPCQWLPPARGGRALRRLLDAAVAPCPPRPSGSDEPGWDRILAGLRGRLAQGSELVLISDFAGLQAHDEPALRTVGRYFDCRGIRIVDPIEHGAMPRVPLRLYWDGDSAQVDAADPAVVAELSSRQRTWEGFLDEAFRLAGIRLENLSVDAEVADSPPVAAS
jgi:uncharacterized protein (DUF58 family)